MNRISALKLASLFILMCCGCCAFSQGSSSNQGKEFWTGYMSHISGNSGPRGSRMTLYITSDVNTSGKVEIADGSFAAIPFNVVAKQVTPVDIPPIAYINAQGKFNKGLHITSLRNIAVYGHIYAASVSGATLLLPVTTLGKSYYSINYKQDSNSEDSSQGDQSQGPSYSSFMVIATEDNTTVEIKPSRVLLDGRASGVPFQIILNKGEVYEGLANTDLTNTRIRTIVSATGECKKIAVFSGSTKMGIGYHNDNFSSDNLFQQVYPTSAWGKTYITVPLKNRDYDVYRVVVSDPNTVLKIDGAIIPQGQFAGTDYYEFPSRTPHTISADKPIQVAQYAVTQGKKLNTTDENSTDIGDPEMIFLNPIEQTLDHVTLYSTSRYNILKEYINVVIKNTGVASFKLDNVDYSEYFRPMPQNEDYSYAQINVTAGTHTIKSKEGFNAIAYGFGDRESYGYAAGASLKNLNQYITLADPLTNKTQDNGCTGVQYLVQLALPYKTARIEWDFHDGTAPYIDNNPVVKKTMVREGKTIYIYEYFKKLSFTAGDYSLTATVINPVADECGTEVNIDFNFNIADYPTAKFTSVGGCPNAPLQFTDESDAKGSTLQTWLWDFGDGTTSDEQNPKHVFAQAGDYTTKLIVVNENGCSSSQVTRTVHILNKPVAKFTLSAPVCAGSDVTFTDQSVSEGTIVKWIWDFGDGSPVVTHANNSPLNHAYALAGNYTVKLTITNSTDCVSDVFEKAIDVKPLPKVDFTLPDYCVGDVSAKFADISTITDNTQAGFTYSWNFGDTHLQTGQANTAAGKSAEHKYSQIGVYQVTLTVTTANGCTSSKTKAFTVNGADPRPDFVIQNSTSLCSNNGVSIKDISTVDFGKITRIIIFYDYDNNPQQYEEYNTSTMHADGIYSHDYGALTVSTPFNIQLEAYSGATCATFKQRLVTINPQPVVKVSKIGSLCYSDAPAHIMVNLNGFTGTGTFSGTGVTSAGVFDPRVAGPGTHTIVYKFVTNGGCDFTDTQDIVVNPDPVVNAGTDFLLLEGEGFVMPATATGNGLAYKWLPSNGLDHDDVLNPVVKATDDTNYKLTVTSAEGCTAFDEIFVKVLKTPIVVNAFTPNGDGINDTWTIKNIETYPGNTVDIYNRYGEKVYSSVGYAVAWDGKYHGVYVPAGAYYYIINPKNGRKPISGNVTVIR
ncbi:PKD domain-containing protein [Inquilinus sp. KBS0705]|nr:PKD domain-containing protein [Inquilinus sp. KBS0705]